MQALKITAAVGSSGSVPVLPQNFHPLSRSLWHFHWHHLMTQNDMDSRPRRVIHDNTFECHQNWQHHCSHGTGQTWMFEWYWCIFFVRPKLLANVTTSIQKSMLNPVGDQDHPGHLCYVWLVIFSQSMDKNV